MPGEPSGSPRRAPLVPDAPLPPLQIVDVQRRVGAELDRIGPVIDELGARFAAAGEELALVGGPVRDAMLGRLQNDLDFTTSARPDVTERLLKGWADAIWDMGRAFGTIGCRKGRLAGRDHDVPRRDLRPRLPQARRRVRRLARRRPRPPGLHGQRDGGARAGPRVRGPVRRRRRPRPAGAADPGRPEDSFSDDPLRMMRAARFAAQLGFTVAPEVVAAMTAMAERIEIISAERVRDELVKLVCAPYPRLGLTLLVETGLAAHVLPGAARARARARRAPPAQGRLRAHPDRARAVDRPRAPARRRPRLRLPVRRADARHRQAAHPPLRVGRRR